MGSSTDAHQPVLFLCIKKSSSTSVCVEATAKGAFNLSLDFKPVCLSFKIKGAS